MLFRAAPGRRFSRNPLRSLAAVLVVGLLLLFRVFFGVDDPAAPVDGLTEGMFRVERVVDGDTLKLATGERVRLQGVDTPESVKPDSPVEPWGPEASEFTRRFVDRANGSVKLTFGKERLDKYGRYLAFVWDGESMLNEELVRAGLSRARLDYRYSGTMKNRLADAEDEARSAGLGIWSKQPPPSRPK